MNWHRLALVLLIPAAYVSCAMLLGTLLASKVAPPPMTPEQKAHYDASDTFAAKYNVRSNYRAAEHLDVLDAGPAQMKFLTTDEFLLLVANPSCVNKRIQYSDASEMPETVPDDYCLRQAGALSGRDKDTPLAYTVALMCHPLYWTRTTASHDWFVFHDPDACLSTAAKVTKWKGYDDLKLACAVESRTVSQRFPGDSEENLARTCVTQNLNRWIEQERDRCRMRQLFSTRSCF